MDIKGEEKDLNNVQSMFLKLLIPALVDTLAHFKDTCNVCLAMNCLSFLVKRSSCAQNTIQEVDQISSLIEQAKEYGCGENLLLQKTAGDTMQIFRDHSLM